MPAGRSRRSSRTALTRAGLEGELYRIGLNTDCGMRGRFLPTRLKLAVPLAQALIKAPQIAVLDLAAPARDVDRSRPRSSAGCANIARGMTLFLLLADASLAQGISPRIVFNGPSGVIESDDPDGLGENANGSAPPRRGVVERMEARP